MKFEGDDHHFNKSIIYVGSRDKEEAEKLPSTKCVSANTVFYDRVRSSVATQHCYLLHLIKSVAHSLTD